MGDKLDHLDLGECALFLRHVFRGQEQRAGLQEGGKLVPTSPLAVRETNGLQQYYTQRQISLGAAFFYWLLWVLFVAMAPMPLTLYDYIASVGVYGVSTVAFSESEQADHG